MDKEKLSRILNSMYNNAPDGDKVAMIHLFGIMFANEITQNGLTPASITEGAEINSSYSTEVSKGMKLSKYVSPTPESYNWVLTHI